MCRETARPSSGGGAVVVGQVVVVALGQPRGPVLPRHLVEEGEHGAPGSLAAGRGGKAPDPTAQDLRAGEAGVAGESVEQPAVVRGEVDLDRLTDDAAVGFAA